MKKLMLGTTLLLSFTVGAQTAAMAANWTGLYIGANAGASFNHSQSVVYPTGCLANGTCGNPDSNPLRTDKNKFDQNNFVGGAQIGYNYQLTDDFVAGVEADFDYNGINDTESVNRPLAAPLAGNFIHSVSQKLDWLGTARLRLGVPIFCRWMIYGTGGFAYGHVSSSSTVSFSSTPDAYAGSVSSTRNGWTVGAGLEYAFSDNISARAEYSYVDLGRISYNDAGNAAAVSVGSTYGTDVTTRDNMLRFSLNYKFSSF